MLFIILFSTVFGLAIRSSKSKNTQVIKDFWEGIYLVFLKIMRYILFFMPYGVFCLVVKTTIDFSPDSYIILSKFFFTVTLGLLIHLIVFYPLVLYLFKRNILGRQFSISFSISNFYFIIIFFNWIFVVDFFY